MKNLLVKSVSYALILVLGIAFTFSSCESAPEPMSLPPAESLVLDLSQFPHEDTATKSMEKSIGNWLYSYLTVFGWNVVIAVNIAIPVAAYAEAFNHTPVYLENNTWEWSYSVPVNGKTYEASLVGTRLDNETFSMEMTLSQLGGFQDFKWFDGVIRYDHTEASWNLIHSPLQPVKYLSIHFQKDYETEIGSIRYTVTDPDPEKELYKAYIEYGVNPTLDFDAHYTVFKKLVTTKIEWNTTTNAGHVKDTVHFADENWHCWDGQLMDVNCVSE